MFNKQFNQLYSFLNEFENIALNEVLQSYPKCRNDYPTEWVDYLLNITTEQLWELDSKKILTKKAPQSFIDYMTNIKKLTSIPRLEAKKIHKLPSWAWHKISHKKRHEIEQIINNHHDHNLIIDICGGQGNTSRIYSNYLNIKSLVIDFDQDLIDLGKKRVNKYPLPNESKEINFIKANLNKVDDVVSKLKDVTNSNNDSSFILGLHTCGSLAIDFFKVNEKLDTSFLNFGCCYGKLNPKSEVNLSEISKKNSLKWSNYALTLATRSNFNQDFDTFLFTKNVKEYRYALDLYIKEELGIKKFLNLGNSPTTLYKKSFKEYVIVNLKNLNLEIISDPELFFNSKYIQNEVKKMFILTIIRWQLARPLEVYILLDRYFYLIEKNINVSINQYFDESLSPRNIGLSYFKNKI